MVSSFCLSCFVIWVKGNHISQNIIHPSLAKLTNKPTNETVACYIAGGKGKFELKRVDDRDFYFVVCPNAKCRKAAGSHFRFPKGSGYTREETE